MAERRSSGAAASCWQACTAWCSLPAAWVGVAVLVAVGCLLGSLQVAVALVVLIFSPILRRCMLALVRHVYPTEAGRIHVWSLLWLRRWWLRDRRHARPLRIDLRPHCNDEERWVASDDEPRCSIHIVAGLLDNYSYILVDRTSEDILKCCVVDPGDADAVLEALAELREQHYDRTSTGVRVESILVTHKHWDHQAGVRKLIRIENITKVFAGQNEPVKGVTHKLTPYERFSVGSLILEAVPSPCHTQGHTMFALLDSSEGRVEALFSGDTLFCGGCGAPFEGPSEHVAYNFRALYHRCDDTSLIFPGHEYSETLLLEYFGGGQPTPGTARHFSALCDALQRTRDRLAHSLPSVPVVLGDEVMYNQHFLSLHSAASSVCDAWRVFSRAVLRQASQYSQPPEAPQRTASTLRRLLEGVQQPMLESGAPPAADATPADADPLLEASFAEEDHALELVDLARPRQRRPTRDVVRHRVICRRNWKPGDRVQLRVSGVDLECTVPDGASPGQEFVARVERARLPSLIALDRRDFDPSMQRVWRRDLERLQSLLQAHRYDRADTLSRKLLGDPLRDARDWSQTPGSAAKRRATTHLAPAHYHTSDEPQADAAAALLDEEPWDAGDVDLRATAPFDDGGFADASNDRRRPLPVATAYGDIMTRESFLFDPSSPSNWRDELREASHVRAALACLASLNHRDGDPILFRDLEGDEDDAECTDSDLRRALTTLGSRPLTHAQVTDLLAVAALCGAADGGAPSERRRGGAPVPVRARRLASVLATDRGVEVAKPRRFCGCCAV
jgi:glyoxylase-like metal-dependent hydrolase (beta-lactamase superfamily II)